MCRCEPEPRYCPYCGIHRLSDWAAINRDHMVGCFMNPRNVAKREAAFKRLAAEFGKKETR